DRAGQPLSAAAGADPDPASPGVRAVVRDRADGRLAPALPGRRRRLRPPARAGDELARRGAVRGGVARLSARAAAASPEGAAAAAVAARAAAGMGLTPQSRKSRAFIRKSAFWVQLSGGQIACTRWQPKGIQPGRPQKRRNPKNPAAEIRNRPGLLDRSSGIREARWTTSSNERSCGSSR